MHDAGSASCLPGLFVAHGFEVGSGEAGGGWRADRVVVILVHAAAEVGLEVGVHRQVVFDVGSGVADGETGAAAIRGIGRRSVNGAIIMQGALAGLEAELDGGLGGKVGAVFELQAEHGVGALVTLVFDQTAAM